MATWDRPYREPIAALIAAGVLGAFVVSRLPAERIVRGPFREAFFVTWSVVDVAIICVLAYLDGGLTSPAALMLFLTLVFAATSYPVGSMVIVVVASVAGVAILGLVGGATDQPFEPDPAYVWVFLVSMALTGVLCMWQSRLGERHREELAELSRTDPLTGCLNRRGFTERLDAELGRAEREGGEVALIQLDLNGFKAVNDRHGHAAGDELLRWVGSTLKALLRGSDATGRLGGDEFALLLPAWDPTRHARSPRGPSRRWPSASARPPASPAIRPTGRPATSCTATPTPSSTAASRAPALADRAAAWETRRHAGSHPAAA